MASTMVNITGTVNANDGLQVRNRPSMMSDIVKTIANGTTIHFTLYENGWYYSSDIGGWAHANYLILEKNTQQEAVSVDKNEQEQKAMDIIGELFNKIGDTVVSSISSLASNFQDESIVDSLLIHNLNGVYGIPYQFMESVDPRINKGGESISGRTTSIMGRKYAEKIIAKMPLLCITPGRADFMSNYSKKDKNGIFAKLASKDGVEMILDDIIKKSGRYFTFAFAYEEYFEYVNTLCRSCAKFLNIENIVIDIGGTKGKAGTFNWQKALNSNLKATLTSQEFIGFYIDSNDSINESFGNRTTSSQIANTVNGYSETAKEISFLLGKDAGATYEFYDSIGAADAIDAISKMSNKYLNGSALLGNIAGNFHTVATGGKLLFPEIWSDSEFSRDFDITIKLRTPDSDILSWYLNICVPICHLIALAAGQQSKDNINGYHSPFLVRAFYKGLFNVDMGIITDMTIKKGKEAAWNIEGLPTEVDVDLTIKDLYNMLTLVPGTKTKDFVTNNILMDYVANMCGININQMDLSRSLEIYLLLGGKSILETPYRLFRRFQDAIDTYGMKGYNAILGKLI